MFIIVKVKYIKFYSDFLYVFLQGYLMNLFVNATAMYVSL